MAKKSKKKDPINEAVKALKDKAVSDATANILNRAGVSSPSLVTSPDAKGGSDVTVGPDGVESVDPAHGGGFLATFGPVIVALGVGIAAWVWLDWPWWGSALAAVAAFVAANVVGGFLGS